MASDISVSQEKADRQANRDTLAQWFKAHPLEDISPAALERMVGRNYQQRISDCRLDLNMNVQNVPKYRYGPDGAPLKRLTGWYRYEPHTRLGRDAGTFQAAGWSTKHGRPFEADFKLTP